MLRMVLDIRRCPVWSLKTLVGQRLTPTFSTLEITRGSDPLLTPVGVPCHRHSPVVMRPALSRSPAFTGEGNHMLTPSSCQHPLHNSHSTSPVPAQAPQARTVPAKISRRPDVFQTRKSPEPPFHRPCSAVYRAALTNHAAAAPANAGADCDVGIGPQGRGDGGPSASATTYHTQHS